MNKKWGMYASILVGLVILSVIATKTPPQLERFATGADLISTNVLQHNLWARKRFMRARAIQYEEATWSNLMSQEILPKLSNRENIYLMADPLDATTLFAEKRSRTWNGPVGYFVALYRLDRAIQVQCSFDFENKKVGYMDRSDYLFVKAICHGYRMKDPSEMRQIPMKDWDRLPTLLDDLDVIVTYIVPESDFHRLLKTQTLSVMGFRNLDIDRIRLFYPFVTLQQVKLPEILRDVPGSGLRYMDREKDTILPSMRMQVIVLKGSYREGFESFRLQANQASLDPSYRCYGDTSLENKALCESPYDVMGMPKRIPTYWDRPCVRNEDCPYFKTNQNYENARGGCLKGGVCEMPVGVKRIAYRMHNSKGRFAPFCYGCKDPLDPACCDDQYMPDYAFPNDQAPRRQQGMEETSIAMK